MSDSAAGTPKLKDRLESLITEMLEKGILFNEAAAQFEKQFIQKALRLHKGNITRTAQAIGIHRNTLSKKIEILKS